MVTSGGEETHKKRPPRRSNRDLNSIRLAGVGTTAQTFYRRMRTLFFSNPSQQECERIFKNGSKRRRNYSKYITGANTNANASVVRSGSISPQGHHTNEIKVKRATKPYPEEAAIYVIDNFLTETELEYFDKKITMIPFERSFVDRAENSDNVEDRKDSSDDESAADNAFDVINGKEMKVKQLYDDRNDQSKEEENSSNIVKEQNISQVNNNTDTSLISTNTCTINKQNNKKENENADGKRGKKRKIKEKQLLVTFDDSHRTSTFYSFRKLHDNRISALEQRIATMLGCWVHQIEALQLVRYQPGEFFGIHHDLGNLLEDDTVQLPPKDYACKRRLVTMFCYLNTLQEDEGGCTYFPKCSQLRVKPKRGRAVLWCNITPDGKPDPKTIHAGESVNSSNIIGNDNGDGDGHNTSDFHQGNKESVYLKMKCSEDKGEVGTKKYGLNIWICEE